MWSTLLPGGLRTWWERRQAMRELQQMQHLELQLLKLDDSNPLYRAKMALACGDRAEALRYWTEARGRLPELVATSHDSLEILFGLDRLDEAEALMLEGRKRFPREPYYARGYAEIAARRGDHSEAVKRWAAVRRAFRGVWQAYALGAASLKEVGSLDEAEALLSDAVKRFPGEIGCRVEHAKLADRRKDWPTALHRWEVVSTEFEHPLGVIGVVRVLRQMGRFDEAAERLAAGRVNYPTVPDLVTEQIHLAQARGKEAAELRSWEVLLERFPLESSGYYGAARRLTEMQKFAEADDVLRRAIARFPQDARPAIEYAELAHHRGDWPEAALRWEALRTAWPDRSEGYQRGAQALDALGRKEEAAQVRAQHRTADRSGNAPEDAAAR
jgi:predicted Zn-dependent protease